MSTSTSERKPRTLFFRFFPDDWRRDCACLSLAARGVWIEFIAYAWQRGKPCMKHSPKHFARVLMATEEEVLQAFGEMEEHGIADIVRHPDGEIAITCRRMAVDMEIVEEEKLKAHLRSKNAAAARWENARSNASSNAPSNAQAMPSSASSASAATTASSSTTASPASPAASGPAALPTEGDNLLEGEEEASPTSQNRQQQFVDEWKRYFKEWIGSTYILNNPRDILDLQKLLEGCPDLTSDEFITIWSGALRESPNQYSAAVLKKCGSLSEFCTNFNSIRVAMATVNEARARVSRRSFPSGI